MRLWKTYLIAAVLSGLAAEAAAETPPGDSLLLMFWNCENFFDYIDSGGGDSDREFSPSGEKHWSASRFYAKCGLFSKSLLYIAEGEGCLPDAVGVAEIENAGVLRRLLSSTLLRKLDYCFIHYDSHDHRGIDCALLYRSSRLTPLSSKPCRIDSLATRDILLTQFVTSEGDSLAILVNHHPSKYGGKASEDLRRRAMKRLRALSDSLELEGWSARVAIGDFNEQPPAALFDILPPSLEMVVPQPDSFGGSIRFNGEWQLIDLAFVSPRIMREGARFRVRPLPFLLEKDPAHPGLRPLRTYSGPRWKGGFSDHLPILLTIGL